METAQIVLAILVAVFSIVSPAAGVWWKLHCRILSANTELQSFKTEIAKEIARIELEAKDRFAAVGHLQEVERRGVEALKELSGRIDKVLMGYRPGAKS